MAGLQSPPVSVQPPENNPGRRRRPIHGLLFPRRFGCGPGYIYPEGTSWIHRLCVPCLLCCAFTEVRVCLDPGDAGMRSLRVGAGETAPRLQPDGTLQPAPGVELFEDHDAGFTATRAPLLARLQR